MATKPELIELFKQGEQITGDNFKKLIEYIPNDLSQAQKDFLYGFVDAMPEENGIGDLQGMLQDPVKMQYLNQLTDSIAPEDTRNAFFSFVQSLNERKLESLNDIERLTSQQIDPLTMTTMALYDMVIDTRTKLGEIEQRLQALETPAE